MKEDDDEFLPLEKIDGMHRHTETEENYLKSIYKYSVDGGMVSTTQIAKDLKTTPASVTDMLKRLSDKALVEYMPYRGVRLLPAGEEIALGTIRKHRLWELFLVNVLHFSWDNVHDTAEQLEHVDSPLLIDKLDEFLGYPKYDPHGDPIPSKDGVMERRLTKQLSEAYSGENVQIVGVMEHAPDFLKYLERLGLVIGVQVSVEEMIPFDSSVVLTLAEREIMLSGEFAKQIQVIHVEC